MAWVAFDRGDQERRGVRARRPGRALAARSAHEIHDEVCRAGFDPKLGSFVQSYGSRAARREPAADPARRLSAARRPAHRAARSRPIEQQAVVDGFVLRYDTAADRRRPAAGRGRVPRLQLLARRRLRPARPADDAQRLFERLLGLRNDVGLLAEEYDPGAQRAGSATSRRRSRTSRWSTRRTMSHATQAVRAAFREGGAPAEAAE